MSATAASRVNGSGSPAETVRSFLLAIEDGDLDEALAMLADDVEYINVSLPTVHGRDTIERLFRPMFDRWHGGFRVHFDTIATSGRTVLTERTDELILGPVRQRIWVYGHIEVVDGKITVWRDAFDWMDVSVGLVRGLVGAVVPQLNRPWPGDR